MSDILPKGISSTADDRIPMVFTHPSSITSVLNSRPIAGKATVTPEKTVVKKKRVMLLIIRTNLWLFSNVAIAGPLYYWSYPFFYISLMKNENETIL